MLGDQARGTSASPLSVWFSRFGRHPQNDGELVKSRFLGASHRALDWEGLGGTEPLWVTGSSSESQMHQSLRTSRLNQLLPFKGMYTVARMGDGHRNKYFFFFTKKYTLLSCRFSFSNQQYLLFIYLFIYLFRAVLGFRFCARAFSSCREGAPLFIAVRGPLTIAASLVAEHRLQTRRLSDCGSRAQLLRGMWDLPRPGPEPASPALAGRFSTTAPPRLAPE